MTNELVMVGRASFATGIGFLEKASTSGKTTVDGLLIEVVRRSCAAALRQKCFLCLLSYLLSNCSIP